MLRVASTLGLALLMALPAAMVRGDGPFAVTLNGIALPDADALYYYGNLTSAAATDAACTPSSCLDQPLTLTVPGGFWAATHGGIELTARPTRGAVVVELLASDGTVLASGSQTEVENIALARGMDTGTYTLRVRATNAPASFTGLAQRELRARFPVEELLPDLVVLPISGVTTAWRASHVPGVSCRPYEMAQSPLEQPMRCLRFDTTTGNLGPGRLFLTIPQVAALTGAITGSANFVQEVERSDDGTNAYVVSPAVYHAGHNHYHIANFVLNTLYAYDSVTHTRGAAIGQGHKEGFCPIDEGLIRLGLPNTELPAMGSCTVTGNDITERLDSNYYDQYPASIDDQEIDITGVPPGTYVLVSTVNPTLVVHETRYDDNEARALISIDAHDAHILPGDAP